MANEYTSVAGPTVVDPSISSGLAYDNVMARVCSLFTASRSRAEIPKSHTFTWPKVPMRRLWGFTSR